MSAAIEVTRLRQSYGNKIVIDDFDLKITSGVVGLLGPNGAGKSTLLRTLATVTPPVAGEITYNGLASTSTPMTQLRREIGYLPQDFGYFGSFTVVEFVQYCAWLRGLTAKAARPAAFEALSLVDLQSKAKQKMKTLSGGMLRRAGVASAIVGSPRLVLLDEPTVGLDPEQRLQFRAMLRSLESSAVVLSTHLIEDVAAACGRVVVMSEGHQRFDGTPDQLAECARESSAGDTQLERGYMTMLNGRSERAS